MATNFFKKTWQNVEDVKKRTKAATSFFLSVGDDLNSLTSFQWLLVEWTVLNMEEKKRGSQKQYQEELFDELLLFSAIAESWAE